MKDAINAIVITYINSYGPQGVYELSEITDMPVDLMSEYLFDMVESDLISFDRQLSLFCLNANSIPFVMENSNEPSNDEILMAYEGGESYPRIDSYEDLNVYLHLDHVNPFCYHAFTVYGKKRITVSNGYRICKERCINAPSLELKKRQRWILDNILSKYTPLDCVHGFVRGKSIKTNAMCHIDQNEIGCIDLKDFFPSIKMERVFSAFCNMGYSHSVSHTLTALTTNNGCLPQGAPTSPMLSNIIMEPLDVCIMQYALKSGLVYTRYADDITISGNAHIIQHLEVIKRLVEDAGFNLNESKTHIMNSSTGRKVTGLSVSSEVRVPQYYKRKLRQEIYYCKKYGISYHLKHSNNPDKRYVNYKGYLYGKAYYIKMIEPLVGMDFIQQLDDLFGCSSHHD